MKTRYKIPIIVVCVFMGWILFPNVTGAICYFGYSGGIINDEGMTEPEFCSISGINFFGYSLDTNLFDDFVRAEIFD